MPHAWSGALCIQCAHFITLPPRDPWGGISLAFMGLVYRQHMAVKPGEALRHKETSILSETVGKPGNTSVSLMITTCRGMA